MAPSPSEKAPPFVPVRFVLSCEAHPSNLTILETWRLEHGSLKLELVREYPGPDGRIARREIIVGGATVSVVSLL